MRIDIRIMPEYDPVFGLCFYIKLLPKYRLSYHEVWVISNKHEGLVSMNEWMLRECQKESE